MEPFVQINRTAIIIGMETKRRTVSLSFFFDGEQAKFLRRMTRNDNDITMLGRFRWTNTQDVTQMEARQ